MEASRIVPFPAPEGLSIRVDRDRIVLERLDVHDPGLAAFVAERPEAERPGLLDRAIKIGLVALQGAGVTIHVDAVRRELDGVLREPRREPPSVPIPRQREPTSRSSWRTCSARPRVAQATPSIGHRTRSAT